MTTALTAHQIAELTGGRLVGDADAAITGVQTLDRAGADDLVFVGDAKHAAKLAATQARVVLLGSKLDVPEADGRAYIIVDDVDLALGKVLERFAPPPVLPEPGVHAAAVIDPTAQLGRQLRIGPHVVVGPGAQIGDGCVLHANVTVMAAVKLGAGLTLWPGVVVRERCTIGDGSILHPGVVVGTDGFGYRPDPDGRGIVKIPHIGTVQIGRLVEIGANTTIDRAKFDATVIGDACKIDNLVQIGHNCRLGRGVIIAGATGLAGSIEIGDGVVIGGAADIRDHLTIGPGARIAGGAQVMNDVPAGETWAGSPAQEYHAAVKQYAAVRQLPEIMKTVRKHLRSIE